MSRILVLEDRKIRSDEFKRRWIGNIVDCVETASAAIELLKTTNYDIVTLDHDLGQEINVASGPGTGYEVAKWLEENPDRKPSTIYIHSFNSAGAKNMKAALPEAIIAPGLWTKI